LGKQLIIDIDVGSHVSSIHIFESALCIAEKMGGRETSMRRITEGSSDWRRVMAPMYVINR
jgi:hypothetical protein